MSLWRKRNVQHNEHNEQKHNNLSNPLDLLHEENVRLGLYEGVYDLSIKSEDLSIKSNKIWVDPPEGWKYGFPAIYDPDKDGQLSDWVVRKGYPLLTIKEYGESWAVRCWPAEEPH
jgi:hypothetical protein